MKPWNIGWYVLAVVAVAAGTGIARAEDYKQAAGPCEVQVATYDWHDADRDRDVPVKIYFPKTGDGPFAVIVFSHGLGGSRDGYEYLGRHWASHGYVSVHLQHIGSDTSVWKGKDNPLQSMKAATRNLKAALDRPRDVKFAIDQVEKMQKGDGPLAGRLDLEHVGMAGHSFGAFTTLAVAGQTFATRWGKGISVADPRVKAAIPMSPTVSRKEKDLDKAFGSIRIPCFFMTGTKDKSIITDTTPEERRLAYEHASPGDKYQVVFNGGDHMIFSGRPRRWAGGQKDAQFQELIRMSTTAFWDAYLKGDRKARQWLQSGGLEETLGEDGKLEQK